MSILFSTPCYGGVCTTAYLASVMRLQKELLAAGMDHDFNIGWNESLVTRARNEMTGWFRKTDFSCQMWIDADIQFDPEDVAKLWNLSCEGADIAVAAYSMKLPSKPLSAWKNGKLVKIEECPSEPFEVDYAGTGFMMIKREVIETMAETAESYEGPDGPVAALYMTPIWNDGFESEDYHFCRKAREAGFKIIMDPSIKLGHIGQFRYGA